MIEFIAHLVVTAGLLLLVGNVIKGVDVDGFGSAFLGAVVLALVNAFVRPIMLLLTLPITALTLGLFLLVVNALMLWLMASIAPGIRIKGFGPALWGSLFLAVLNLGVSILLGPGF